MKHASSAAAAILAAACQAGTPAAPAPAAPPEVVVTAALPGEAPPREPPPAPCPTHRPAGIVSIAPDGRAIVTACSSPNGACGGGGEPGDDLAVDVWDVAAGRLARRLELGLPNVVRLDWGPGGLLAAAADPTTGPGEARVWSAATWALAGQSGVYCFQSFAFDPTGKHLVVAGCNGQIHAVDTTTGALVHRPDREAHVNGDYGIEVRYTRDGRGVLVADENGGLQTLRAATLLQRAEAPATHLVCQAFSSHDDRVVVAEGEGTLQIFDASRPRQWTKLARDADHACTAIAWIDAARFAVARDDGTLTVWDADQKRVTRLLRAAGSPVHSLSADAPGALLASADGDALAVWDLATGALRQAIPRAAAPDAGAAFDMTSRPEPAWSPSGEHLAELSDGEAVVWEKRSGKVTRRPLRGDPRLARRLAWSADGAVLAFADEDAHLLRVADGAALTLGVFERGGQRLGLVVSEAGSFTGPDDLARCARLGPAARESRPSLLADFFAGR